MTLEISEILNWIFGGGLVAAVTAIFTISPTVRKAKAEAERARADAETVHIGNAENATRILMENIVEPLKKELHATRREMARLRKAIDGANGCEHRRDCPVLLGLRQLTDGEGDGDDGGAGRSHRQRKKRCGDTEIGDGAPFTDDVVDTSGEPS